MFSPAQESRLVRAPRPLPSGDAWNTVRYLNSYYSRVEPTEKHTLRFVAKVLRAAPPFACTLEFGCGPTLHHALALAAYTRELQVADLHPDNLRTVRRWLSGVPNAHDWSQFAAEILRAEGVIAPNAAQIAARVALARLKLRRVRGGDARDSDPLGATARGSFDCVATFFCVDSATASLTEWQRCLRNIAGLLAPNGLLIMSALRRCRTWRLGESWLPSPCIDERHVHFVLDSAGFETAGRTIEVGEVPDQSGNGFDSILLVAARATRRASAAG